MHYIRSIFLAIVGLALGIGLSVALVSCAFWQKHRTEIQCAAITTVENAPQLVTIVQVCASIAVNVTSVVPCIEAAAGSAWASDVVACFAGHAAGLTTCPSAAASTSLRATPLTAVAHDRLRAAVQAQGYNFAGP